MITVGDIVRKYGVTKEQAELYLHILNLSNVDTEEGYDLFYKLEKSIKDSGRPSDILYEAAPCFAWDDTLTEEFNRRAKADGREDLIDK